MAVIDCAVGLSMAACAACPMAVAVRLDRPAPRDVSGRRYAGALLGLVEVLPPTAAYVIPSGAAIGAGLGAAIGYLRHRLRSTRGELIGLSGVRANAYQIQVDTRHIDPRRAEHRLARYWPM